MLFIWQRQDGVWRCPVETVAANDAFYSNPRSKFEPHGKVPRLSSLSMLRRIKYDGQEINAGYAY
jgi:hypothetical protein